MTFTIAIVNMIFIVIKVGNVKICTSVCKMTTLKVTIMIYNFICNILNYILFYIYDNSKYNNT